MRLSISEILEKVSKVKTKTEKLDLFRQYDNAVLRSVLKHALDKNITFELPEGTPPYRPSEHLDSQGMLYSEARKFYLFVKGGSPNLKQLRRETLFITMLESVDSRDAELLIAMKDKKLPYKGITLALVTEAYPGLIDEQVNV